jgi:hypothetical protein
VPVQPPHTIGVDIFKYVVGMMLLLVFGFAAVFGVVLALSRTRTIEGEETTVVVDAVLVAG